MRHTKGTLLIVRRLRKAIGALELQLALELLDNKHITLDHILSISDILKENARSVGGSGDDVLSKGMLCPVHIQLRTNSKRRFTIFLGMLFCLHSAFSFGLCLLSLLCTWFLVARLQWRVASAHQNPDALIIQEHIDLDTSCAFSHGHLNLQRVSYFNHLTADQAPHANKDRVYMIKVPVIVSKTNKIAFLLWMLCVLLAHVHPDTS